MYFNTCTVHVQDGRYTPNMVAYKTIDFNQSLTNGVMMITGLTD